MQTIKNGLNFTLTTSLGDLDLLDRSAPASVGRLRGAGHRIVVVTARPARIREIIEVPFPYPRDESLQERAEFSDLRKHVRELVMNEYRVQQAQMRPASFSE